LKISFQIFILLFLSISCDVPIERHIDIDAPILVGKSRSDAQIELGIDTEYRLKHGIQIMWYSNNENNVEYYSIHRGEMEMEPMIQFQNIGKVFLDDPLASDTLFFDTTAMRHITYSYFIRAVGLQGNISNSSDTVSYTLNDSPNAISPVNTIADSFPIFRWIDNISNFQYTSEFVIRVENVEQNNVNTVWTSHFYNEWFGFENNSLISFQYFPATCSWGEYNDVFHENAPSNTISCFGADTGLPQGSYRWKIKSISQVNNQNGIDEASGESPWKYFNISF